MKNKTMILCSLSAIFAFAAFLFAWVPMSISPDWLPFLQFFAADLAVVFMLFTVAYITESIKVIDLKQERAALLNKAQHELSDLIIAQLQLKASTAGVRMMLSQIQQRLTDLEKANIKHMPPSVNASTAEPTSYYGMKTRREILIEEAKHLPNGDRLNEVGQEIHRLNEMMRAIDNDLKRTPSNLPTSITKANSAIDPVFASPSTQHNASHTDNSQVTDYIVAGNRLPYKVQAAFKSEQDKQLVVEFIKSLARKTPTS